MQPMRYLGLICSMTVAAAVMLAAGNAAAQPEPPSAAQPENSLTRSERAVEIGKVALSLYRAQRFADAYDKFSEAEQVAHSLVFVHYMARCKRKQGQLLAAQALYRRVLAETPAEDAPTPWIKAHRDAQEELVTLQAEVPTLRLRLARAGAQVWLDERLLSATELAAPVALEVGEYLVRARRPGAEDFEQRLTLARGDRKVLDIALAPLPPAEVPPPPSPLPPPAPAPHAAGSLLPGALVLGVAGVGAVVGAITGGLALSRASDVNEVCPDERCTGVGEIYAQAQRDRDAATTLAHVSTASFVIAGVAAATGVTLLILRPGGDSSAVSVAVAPTGLSLSGRF